MHVSYSNNKANSGEQKQQQKQKSTNTQKLLYSKVLWLQCASRSAYPGNRLLRTISTSSFAIWCTCTCTFFSQRVMSF